jgi:hypothetical protein
MYGAETVLSSAFEGSDGAILKAREIYNENPDLYLSPTNTTTTPTRRRTIWAPAPKSGAKPKAASPIFWPPSARQAR